MPNAENKHSFLPSNRKLVRIQDKDEQQLCRVITEDPTPVFQETLTHITVSKGSRKLVLGRTFPSPPPPASVQEGGLRGMWTHVVHCLQLQEGGHTHWDARQQPLGCSGPHDRPEGISQHSRGQCGLQKCSMSCFHHCCCCHSVLSNSVTPWTAAQQASLSFTISCSLLKLMSIELMMPANHLILCHPLLLPSIFSSIGVFSMSWLFTSGCQSIGASASASVLPMNIQD